MSHFAQISGSSNIVISVIVAEQNFINSGAVGASSNWIQTSYNTRGGIHHEPNSVVPSPVNFQDASGSSYITLEEANASGSGTITPVSQSITLALRKNYAGIGDTYDESKDAFYAPQPEPSASIPYILDEDSCEWVLSE